MRRTPRRGFLLVMVLLVLAIGATVLAAVARASTHAATAASSAQRDLQRRWAVHSVRQAVAATAEQRLREAHAIHRQPRVHAGATLRLGGRGLTVIVTDEQAKANVNLLARASSPADLQAVLQGLQAGRTVLPVELRPLTPEASDRNPLPQRYRSYDQFLRYDRPEDLLDVRAARATGVEAFTCWGDGRIHAMRAGRDVLREVLAGIFDEHHLAELLAWRDEHPDGMLEELFHRLRTQEHLRLDPLKELEARRRLTDRSRCHGVWTIADDGVRRHVSLLIRHDDARDAPPTLLLEW